MDGDVYGVYSTLERAKEMGTKLAADNSYLHNTLMWKKPPLSAEWEAIGDNFQLFFDPEVYYTIEPFEVDLEWYNGGSVQ